MVSIRNFALVASAMIGLTSALPNKLAERQTYVPGTQNNTQEFYLQAFVTDGPTTYTGWFVEAYHTGAGTADPVLAKNATTPAFLNGTNLQFDQSPYPFGVVASISDTNYARWEPVTISSGYGSGDFSNEASAGIRVTDEESDGWIICEWSHGDNAPQLFQLIKGFDDGPVVDLPATCARVVLLPQFF